MVVSIFIWSCEDPTTLAVSKVFSSNKLQTVFVDTFSVVTSVVQLDSVLTNNSGTMLLGKYRDAELGTVSASTYFQVVYGSGQFLPDRRFIFDSAVLVLPYNHVFSGDTSKAVNVNVYQLTQVVTPRVLPVINDKKVSVYNSANGFFNTSKISRAPSPLATKKIKFSPHKDTTYMRLPDSFGSKWFKLAQSGSDSANRFFANVYNFVTYYFYGLNIDVDTNTDACIVGFNTSKVKIRFYYKKYNGDLLQETHYDFTVYNPRNQFNHIEYDRSGTALASLQKLTPFSTLNTSNKGYIQSGTGLVTRLDFPSLKNFFSINNGIILNSASLEIYPVRGSYPKNFLAPSSLQLFSTDISNLPLGSIIGGNSSITYDYEFGVKTGYRYEIFPYIYGQLKSNSTFVTPLILGPTFTNQGGSIQRTYIGDRFYPETKIKLKLFYSYAIN
jgi:hypothetical protein